MRVLLVTPPEFNLAKFSLPNAVMAATTFPPIGLLYISSYLKEHAGCDVRLYDWQLHGNKLGDIMPTIREYSPDVVGIMAYTFCFYDTIMLARMIKEYAPQTHICLGGINLSYYPDESMSHDCIDSIVVGEGEEAFAEICRRVQAGRDLKGIAGVNYRKNGKIVHGPPVERILDLDALPLPDREMVVNEDYRFVIDPNIKQTPMFTVRGCPYPCNYCNVTDKKPVLRSAKNVVDEFEQCVDLGYGFVDIYDDTFNLKLDRAKEICQGIIDRRLKIKWSFRGRTDKVDDEFMRLAAESGCDRVNFGIETATDAINKASGKGINQKIIRRAVGLAQKNDVRVLGYFMLGFPHETEQQMNDTIDFSIELDVDYAQFVPVVPLPGTQLYLQAVREGGLPSDYFREQILNPQAEFYLKTWETDLPEETVIKITQKAYRRFYFRPSYIMKRLADRPPLTLLIKQAGAAAKLAAHQISSFW
jgi:radical SAM superfamily enzyme YgiQ (UPF0313 family)